MLLTSANADAKSDVRIAGAEHAPEIDPPLNAPRQPPGDPVSLPIASSSKR